MSHTSISHIASTVGLGSIAIIAMAVPNTAFAETLDPAAPDSSRRTVDVGAARDEVNPPPAQVRRLLEQIETGVTPAPPSTPAPEPTSRVVRVDDGALEVVQVAIGALTGAAIVAGGAATMRTRQRRHLAHSA
jgi:hypothetical protein